MLQYDVVHCGVLQCVAVCCSVLQCAAVCRSLSRERRERHGLDEGAVLNPIRARGPR